MKDMKTFKNSPGMMHMDRLYETYPKIITGIVEKMYNVEGKPRSKMLKLFRKEAMKEIGITRLISDGFKIGRSLL